MTEKAKAAAKEVSGSCYSNCDHQFDDMAEKQLRNDEVLSHTAWDHYGKVWFADGQFHEEVWQFGSVIDVVSKVSLQDVIDTVNERYGND